MPDDAGRLPTQADFAQQVDETFRASAPGIADLDLALIECNDIANDNVQETFSLLFRAPVDAAPTQTTYSLASGDLGPFDIFLVPVKKDEQGLYFEAVFNRLKDKAL